MNKILLNNFRINICIKIIKENNRNKISKAFNQ